MKRTGIKRKTSLQARNGIKPVTRAKQVRVPTSWGMADRDACRMCGEWANFMDGHHIITSQQLRKSLSHLPDDQLSEVLGDTRNRAWLCRPCHEAHHNRSRPMPQSALPRSVWEFAAIWDLTWFIDRTYPNDEESAA